MLICHGCAVEQGAECLSVMADDTEIYILMLHCYNQKELNIPMFMEDKHVIFILKFILPYSPVNIIKALNPNYRKENSKNHHPISQIGRW